MVPPGNPGTIELQPLEEAWTPDSEQSGGLRDWLAPRNPASNRPVARHDSREPVKGCVGPTEVEGCRLVVHLKEIALSK